MVCLAGAVLSQAQTFTTLVNFDGANGAYPAATLVQATNGDLYGTTSGGGNNYGTIFKITPAGVLTTLYSFNLTDGAGPSVLVQATNGYLYGTTYYGGLYNDGTVFRITPQGTLTNLYNFSGVDGASPFGGLLQAANGDLYGTTSGGGIDGFGTVFKITPSGSLTTLHGFIGTDGALPVAGLIQATNRELYGTTSGGGANSYGTIFRMSPSGAFATLHSFDGTDGRFPTATLIQATNGSLYGTTQLGGINGANSYGTIFEITPTGAPTTFYNFDSADGALPNGTLIQTTSGEFYGTTLQGGAVVGNYGTVFKITAAGTLTTLRSFEGFDGGTPSGGLVQDTNGDLYGTTAYGGPNGSGTIFKLSVGLGPFVRTLPTSGPIGSSVEILGSDLSGATNVMFNGVPAVFTVVSAREISTTVPAGASRGKVEVTTPSGTLLSNEAFFVP